MGERERLIRWLDEAGRAAYLDKYRERLLE